MAGCLLYKYTNWKIQIQIQIQIQRQIHCRWRLLATCSPFSRSIFTASTHTLAGRSSYTIFVYSTNSLFLDQSFHSLPCCRLASCQATGLIALWRLFIGDLKYMFWVWLKQLFSSGKKYNPLRDRVDSADCSVEQLFLGDPSIFIIFIFFLLFLHTTKACTSLI